MSYPTRFVTSIDNGRYLQIYIGNDSFDPICEWLKSAGFVVEKDAVGIKVFVYPFRPIPEPPDDTP